MSIGHANNILRSDISKQFITKTPSTAEEFTVNDGFGFATQEPTGLCTSWAFLRFERSLGGLSAEHTSACRLAL